MPVVSTWSEQGEAFTLNNESCPERAYKDPGGVVTIGPGLTELDATFKEYWRRTRGHALRVGDTLPRAEALTVFRSVMTEHYLPAVVSNIEPEAQNVLDAGADVAWNCGPGSTLWNWAKAARAHELVSAAALLLTTATTAGGIQLQGLVNRRQREARLLRDGDYGNGPSVAPNTGGITTPAGVSQSIDEIKQYQGWLKALGLYQGSIDGKAGKGSLTFGAVQNFQRMTPGLKVDGVVGSATRSALVRAVGQKKQGIATLGGGTLSGGGFLGLHLDPWWIIGGAVVVAVLLVVGFYIWNNRGRIMGVRTPA